MRAKERRRKFHEGILNVLYPLPPQQEDDNKSVNPLQHLDHLPDGLEESDSSSHFSSSDENGPHKLTRAQRKRVRRKKLKEAASRRRKIIGPMLPSRSDGGDDGGGGGEDVLETESQDVRRNAAEELDAGIDKPGSGESVACNDKNKLKQRRKAKRLAKEKVKASSDKDGQACSED